MNEQIDMENTIVAHAMILYGSIFEKRLGRVLLIGGTDECTKIKATWPELWEGWVNLVRDSDFRGAVFVKNDPLKELDALDELDGAYKDVLEKANNALDYWSEKLKEIYSLLSGSDPDKVNKAIAIIEPFIALASKDYQFNVNEEVKPL